MLTRMPASGARPPNILLILADDLGLCDLGRGGAPGAHTPHLDALAESSVQVARFRTASVCAPSRAMLLTGRHHLRTGVWGVHGGQDYLDRGEELLPQILARHGYATGMWGKWHNGHTEGYLPWQRGFDEALMLDLYRHRDPGGRLNGETRSFPGRWADDVIVEHAIAFIQGHREQPFFAYLPSMTPHTPLGAPDELVADFRAKGCRAKVATLRAQVAMLDAAIGRLLAALDRLGLADDTIVLFLSDNGPACNEESFDDADRSQRDPGSLRGWKGDLWENGVRSPLFIRWNRCLAPGLRDGDAWLYDLLPTLCNWAGVAPAGRPLDGLDLGRWLDGGSAPDRPGCTWVLPAVPPVPGRSNEQRTMLDEYRPLAAATMPPSEQVSAAYEGSWKLLRRPGIGFGDLSNWLANLDRDPGERVNRIAEDPATAQRLAGRLDDWWREIGSEPGAFRPPAFVIDALRNSEVRACAPLRLDGALRNDGFALCGWDASGTSAVWSVEVVRGGPVTVRTHWKGIPPGGLALELSASGAVVRGTVAGDGGIAWDAPLTLDAGPATLSLTVADPVGTASLLRLELLPATESTPPSHAP